MESETPPQASSPNRTDDFEVSSRRISPDQQVVRGTMKTTPEGETSVAQGPGCAALTGINHKGLGLSGFQPMMILETGFFKGWSCSFSGFRRPGGAGYLEGHAEKSICLEDHRTLMGTVVEKSPVRKSGLNEAFKNLLRGFEVCNVICVIVFYSENTPVYRQ